MIKLTVLIPDGYTRLDGVIEIYDPVHGGQPGQLPYQYLPLDCDLSPRQEIRHSFSCRNQRNFISGSGDPVFVAGDNVNPFDKVSVDSYADVSLFDISSKVNDHD